jgi:hypothetical protein
METKIAVNQVEPKPDSVIADENWQRYVYVRGRGHIEYCAQAKKCEGFYLGGGLQWSDDDRAILKATKRPAYEFNEIMPAVNTALGYQINNRLDISFQPRGGQSDMDSATLLNKVIKQITDAVKLQWKETQVLGDGLIQQRGYYDVRMDFGGNMRGDVAVFVIDPLDVIPDPDAKSYDPEEWGDVVVTRWLSVDEIAQLYGMAVSAPLKNARTEERDFGDMDGEANRNKFGSGDQGTLWDSSLNIGVGVPRIRVVDRQHYIYALTPVLVYPKTGDVRIIRDQPTPEQLADWQQRGLVVTKRVMKRVRWTVSTMDTLLHDDWSPYTKFTIVPYFPYFRRGVTRGMVDNAISPQEAINKGVSQFVHIINGTANTGWTVEQNSLTNMSTDELEENGATTGLVVEFKKGFTKPEKIQPNQVPTGVDKLIDRATMALKDVTVPEAMRGQQGPEKSGIAIQSTQHASQQQLAVPLDNLARTRHMLAERFLELVQTFYDDERVFRITEDDPKTGKKMVTDLSVNQLDPATGNYRNDLTLGEYDVVINEQPLQVTFENSQFQQGLEMKKVGIAVPDDVIVRHSNLADKQEILERMANESKSDPLKDAKVALTNAQAQKTSNEAVTASVTAQFEGIQTAQVIAQTPATAPIADAILKSAGFKDQDAAPIIPTPAGPSVATIPPPQANTNPLTPKPPATGAIGAQAGIEGGQQ